MIGLAGNNHIVSMLLITSVPLVLFSNLNLDLWMWPLSHKQIEHSKREQFLNQEQKSPK